MIKLIGISKETSKKSIIKNFDFTFLEGEVYQLKGKNGSGKSTLLKLMAGIVDASSGQIIYDGFESNPETIEYLKQNYICYIDQVYDLVYDETVLYNLKLESIVLNKYLDIALIEKAINVFNLKSKLNMKVKHLSGGERKIVSFLKGYFSFKKVVLYDEITAHIDTKNKSKMLEMIKHDMNDKVVIMTTNEKLDIGTIINLEENNFSELRNYETTIKESNKRDNTINSKFRFNIFKLNFETILIMFLVIMSTLLVAIKVTMESTNYGEIYYKEYLINENNNIIIFDPNGRIQDLQRLNDLNRIVRSKLKIDDKLITYEVSTSSRVNQGEIIISKKISNQFDLSINDVVLIEDKIYKIQDILTEIMIISDVEIIFNTYPETLSNLEQTQYYFSYNPSKELFHLLGKHNVNTGYYFEQEADTSLVVNEMLVYEVFVDALLAFVVVSTLITLVYYHKQVVTNMWLKIFILYNQGATIKYIHNIQNKRYVYMALISTIITMLLYIYVIYLLNNHLISISNITFIIFENLSLMSILIVFMVAFLYAIISIKKVKINKIY